MTYLRERRSAFLTALLGKEYRCRKFCAVDHKHVKSTALACMTEEEWRACIFIAFMVPGSEQRSL